MKKLKSITVALALSVATVFSVSSCLDSGNGGTQYPQMSLSDSIEAVNNAIGSFTGKLYYINPTKTTSNREDSVDVKWRISKETMTIGGMTIENFPIKPLALYVTNMTSMVKSKEILEAAPEQIYTTSLIPYLKLEVSNSSYFQYSILPKKKELEFSVEYAGSAHRVKVIFAEYITDASGYYYYPVAYKREKLFQGNIIINKVTVDGVEHSVGTVFGIKGHLTTAG